MVNRIRAQLHFIIITHTKNNFAGFCLLSIAQLWDQFHFSFEIFINLVLCYIRSAAIRSKWIIWIKFISTCRYDSKKDRPIREIDKIILKKVCNFHQMQPMPAYELQTANWQFVFSWHPQPIGNKLNTVYDAKNIKICPCLQRERSLTDNNRIVQFIQLYDFSFKSLLDSHEQR